MNRSSIVALTLILVMLCIPRSTVPQDIQKPAPKAQVMLGIRVLKVVLTQKNSGGLEWEKMPFKQGLNKKIDFYSVLRALKSAGDMEVLFNQSLIAISGGRIESDTTITVPAHAGGEGSIEVGGSFKGDIDIMGDEVHLALDYKISYLYGPPPRNIAKTDFKGNVGIGNGQTLVLDDLIVERGEEERFAEVLVFISASIVK